MKIRKDGLLISLLFLLIISSPYIQQTISNFIKLVIEIFILVLIYVVNKKYNKNTMIAILPCILFFISTTYSTYRWSGISTRFVNSIVTNFAYLLFFYVLYYQCKKDEYYVKKVVYKNILFYTLILDFFVLVTRGKGLGGLSEPVYLLGNKFMVSYFHMALLSMMIDRNDKVFKIMLYAIYSIFVCRIADTMTGVLGVLFIFIYQILIKKNTKLYSISTKPTMVLTFFIGLNAIFLLTNTLLQNEMITTFLMKYSHTDTLLSGRLPMYKIVINSIATNKLWGYGINYDIVQKTLTFGNPQNGLLKIFLDYGIIGLILFCLILLKTFNLAHKVKSLTINHGLVVFIYGMLFCSLIEINLDSLFFFMLALLFSCANSCYEKGIR